MSNITCPKCGTVIELDEGTYYSLLSQVRDDAFRNEMEERLADAVRNAVLQEQNRAKDLIGRKDAEITGLRAKLEAAGIDRELAVTQAVAGKEAEITELKQAKSRDELAHQFVLQGKDDEIARLKDYKLKQSTKMIGEDLEQYCWTEFEKIRTAAYPDAYFEKDSDTSVSGTKGDFIFRDYDADFDGNRLEYISIMFEMKNEADETATKHKNADFFDKLDKDRKAKKCEYAVLVSALEADNELYNAGIFEVAKYEKMYVVRPQQFLTIISLLRNIARQGLGYRQELAVYRSQNVDVESFVANLNASKERFGRVFENAQKKHSDAIAQIDKAIADLTKARDALVASDNNILSAENRLDEITIKKLTKKNPTMLKKFIDAGVEIE